MTEVLSAALLLLGASFMLLAAVGIIRLPDLYSRLHATTKPATLGIGFMLLAVAVHFGELGVATRAVAGIIFFFLTVPVSGHMLGRAAYLIGAPLWERAIIDELRGRYDPRTHILGSRPPGSDEGNGPKGTP